MLRKWNLHITTTASGNVKWYNHFVNVWQFLKRLNIESPYYPAISLLGILKRTENICPQKNLDLNLHSSIHNSQKEKTTQMSIN